MKQQHKYYQGKIQISLSPNEKIVYIENSKESTKTPTRLIGEFSKFTEHKAGT